MNEWTQKTKDWSAREKSVNYTKKNCKYSLTKMRRK